MLIPGPAQGSTGPVTHAFVVGVGEYPFLDGPNASDFGASFGMENLTSAARSASEVAGWLLTEFQKPEAPLASLRILLSPVDGEQLNEHIAPYFPARDTAPATRAAVEAEFVRFTDDCAANPDGFAFVYIAGHGVQLTTSASVVLLHDFADPNLGRELTGAMDVSQCHHGLSGGGYPRTQAWFADACRQVPDVARRFETMRKALDASKPFGDVEASALVLAAGPRESAFAEVGGSSLFSQALLWALRGGAAAPTPEPGAGWWVRAAELVPAVKDRIDHIGGPHGVQQNIESVGRTVPVVVQRFDGTPEVDLQITVRPTGLTPPPQAWLAFNGSEPVAVEPDLPLSARVPAGPYLLNVEVEPPLPAVRPSILNVRPPAFAHEVVVSP